MLGAGAEPYCHESDVVYVNVAVPVNVTFRIPSWMTRSRVEGQRTRCNIDYVNVTVPVIVSEFPGNIVVRVKDEAGTSIVGAQVESLAQPSGQGRLNSQTNDQGLAAFGSLKPGVYLIQASSPGFVSASKNVTVNSRETVNEELILARPKPPDNTSLLLLGGAVAGVGVASVLGLWLLRSRRRRDGSRMVAGKGNRKLQAPRKRG